MPKSGVDGPSYAGHVNVAPEGQEPEWVLEQDAPAAVAEKAEEAPKEDAKPEAKPAPARRVTQRKGSKA